MDWFLVYVAAAGAMRCIMGFVGICIFCVYLMSPENVICRISTAIRCVAYGHKVCMVIRCVYKLLIRQGCICLRKTAFSQTIVKNNLPSENSYIGLADFFSGKSLTSCSRLILIFRGLACDFFYE